nr:tyrosine-type recombinase/integrase [uncultured Lichenicoccus sp.]
MTSSEDRVVRKRLADGAIKEYRYPRSRARPPGQHLPNSLGAMLVAYRRSPNWTALAEASRKQYTIYLRPIESISHLPVRDIYRRQVLAIRDALALRSGNGAASVFVRVVSAVFAWAVDRNWIDFNPASRIKALETGHLVAWTVEQAEHAIAHLEEPLRRVVLFGMYTGQRRADMCRLTWSAYDGHVLHLTQGKTKVSLVVPVHPRLKAEMDVWRSTATSTAILTSLTGRPWRSDSLSHRMRHAVKAAGLPSGLNIHGLRKLAATMLAEAGCSTHEIAAITGHKTLSMVALYTASVSQEKLAKAAVFRLQTGTRNRSETG